MSIPKEKWDDNRDNQTSWESLSKIIWSIKVSKTVRKFNK